MSQQPHDNAYKLLFSHSEMVADLLRGYLARDWIDELDLTRLEIVTGSQVGDALSERRNDCIWRLPWKGKAGSVAGGEPVWLYIYLMLEFQSTVDPTMPVRMMAYLALLYQGLLRSGQITAEALPPVLPVVLYNGRARWTAANRVEDLIPRYPAALAPYIPRVQYLFLDEGRMATSEQMEERNLAAAVFRLEQGMAPEALRELGRTLDAWLKAPSQSSLREALCTFVRRSIAVRRLPGAELPGRLSFEETPGMIADWLAESMQEHEARGEARGKAEGRAEGLIRHVRHQVAKGILTVDQAKAEIREMVAMGEIPAETGETALKQLG